MIFHEMLLEPLRDAMPAIGPIFFDIPAEIVKLQWCWIETELQQGNVFPLQAGWIDPVLVPDEKSLHSSIQNPFVGKVVFLPLRNNIERFALALRAQFELSISLLCKDLIFLLKGAREQNDTVLARNDTQHS